ncbi:hypothetical protein [Kitasatospora sp. NPDC004531]
MKKNVRLLFVVCVGLAGALLLPHPPQGQFGLYLLALFGGLLAASDLTQLVLALLAPLGGLRPLGYGLGIGGRLFAVPLGGRRLIVRDRPFPLFHGMYQRIRVSKARSWAVTAAAYALPVLLGAWVLTAAGGAWRMFGSALVAMPPLELVMTAGVAGQAGWVLLRLPAASGAALADLYAGPAETAARQALENGRVEEAAAALAGAPAGEGLASAAVRVHVRLALGQWQRALDEADRLTPGPLTGSERSVALLRGLTLVCGADAGLLPAPDCLPRLMAAVETIGDRPQAALLRADLRRLTGDPAGAAKASAMAVRLTADALTSANALCSRAAALFATGQPEQAHRALEQARKLVPGLARIALVEHRAAPVAVLPAEG